MSAPIQWQKSTFSGGGSSEDCVELATADTAIRLRESERPTAFLTAAPASLRALLSTLKAGRLASR
ncbi:DUF397 domain-containing protein [Streptomyces flaveus]|uniref:DUF397 domain-containing protein n=1 Tax=Streptomyces flaveus TaxID=66370 RepID=A0A917RKR3_9ACTN|nr:DUF397 domain-containing protein [Streptomyces flaveus]GGL11148.1 hypothetical protein GCM10010094_85000 [Streptomyces flaveus]